MSRSHAEIMNYLKTLGFIDVSVVNFQGTDHGVVVGKLEGQFTNEYNFEIDEDGNINVDLYH